MRPGEHAGGLVFVEERKAHEQAEHGAAERFSQSRGVVGGPRDERPVGPDGGRDGAGGDAGDLYEMPHCFGVPNASLTVSRDAPAA